MRDSTLQMTHDELLLKVTELRAHGYGALAHALELEKYAASVGAVAQPNECVMGDRSPVS